MSPSGPEQITVACAVEGESYVRHCAAMLHSLLTQHPSTPVSIHYLHGDDTSERGRRRLKEMVERMGGQISFHRVSDAWVEGLPIKGFTRKATWYRILLPELLPYASRVIYLDVDVLVTDSLLGLWSTDLEGQLIGAVNNVLQESDRDHAVQIGLPNERSYFNAGVLLMDLDRMRTERTSELLREFSIQNAARLGWRDQDALNLVLHERRTPLHPRFNCMNAILYFPWASQHFGAEALREARERPAIRHFEGPSMNKPWHLLCEPTARRLYAEHRRGTPWPRVRPAGCTPGNLLRYARARRERAQA